jgi:hypothetical protein
MEKNQKGKNGKPGRQFKWNAINREKYDCTTDNGKRHPHVAILYSQTGHMPIMGVESVWCRP